jgi:hypothetical protein
MNNERVTLAHAAAHVGFHLNTIKAWRKANELQTAEKLVEKGIEIWYVDLEEVTQVAASKRARLSTQPSAQPGYPVRYPTPREESTQPETAVTLRPDELFLQAVERAVEKAVVPLNETINSLTVRNEDLASRAAKFEERSTSLEERVKQLEASQTLHEALQTSEPEPGTQLGTLPVQPAVQAQNLFDWFARKFDRWRKP